MISNQNISERLKRYHPLLKKYVDNQREEVKLDEIARLLELNSSIVRRDFMFIGMTGKPETEFSVKELLTHLNVALENGVDLNICIIGAGPLGAAAVTFITEEEPDAKIIAAFDSDSRKHNKVFRDVTCFPIRSLEKFVKEKQIIVAAITVPKDEVNQAAHLAVKAGIQSIWNFTPVSLDLPDFIYLEEFSITSNLEMIEYLSQ